MKGFYQQTSRFAATRAQIEYLRAVHHGLQSNTNGATRARCYRFLVFADGKASVNPEIVKQLGLDK